MIKPENFFDDHSSLYNYRLKYHEQFFKEISTALNLNGDEHIFDICCGNGQIAYGMINYVGSAVGVDSSQNMLGLAAQHDRITYLCADINYELLPKDFVDNKFDYFFIGHAIHWIQEDALEKLIIRNLKKNGIIIILGNHWDPTLTWVKKLNTVIEPYKSFDIFDVDGRIKLSDCGFSLQKKVVFTYNSTFSLEAICKYVESLARYGEKIKLVRSSFITTLSDELSPFANIDLDFNARVINWALCYQKK